ncbi:MAG: ABC transporter ATP-binding protein [Bacillota bacterium]
MVIEMKQVSVLRNSKYLLKEINWSVASGEHWAVLGLNGSGKTTLLHMVNGYLFPSKGEVAVLGKTFGKYDLRELRKSIGWVSTALQEKLYTKESAKDIILSGKYATIGLYDHPEKEDMERSDYLLEQFGCSHLAHRPYQTLSQGEKQRVLIARALMASPRLLILDEPCTGLDIIAKEQLLSAIQKLSCEKNGPTLIYVTHRTDEILPIFTHTLLLRSGQVHASGKTTSLLTCESLSEFFQVPVHIEHHQDRTWIHLDSL